MSSSSGYGPDPGTGSSSWPASGGPQDADSAPGAPGLDPDAALIEEELLVEEISIDGMCGVY